MLFFLSLGDSDPKFLSFGLRPIGTLKMRAVLVKKLSPGRKVGYSMTYEIPADSGDCGEGEWIGTFGIGYADGLWRHLSSNGNQSKGFIRRDKTGER